MGVLFLVTAGLFALLLRSIDLRAFASSLKAARWGLVALAGAIALIVCNGLCVLRLWTLLSALPRSAPPVQVDDGAPPAGGSSPPGLRTLLSIYLVTTAAHNLLPSFAGDALRTVQIHRHGYRVGATVAVQLVERVIDALSLGLLTLGIAASGSLPPHLARPLGLLAAGGLLGAAALFFVARSRWRLAGDDSQTGDEAGARKQGFLERLRRALYGFLRTLVEGIRHLRRPRRLALALGWSLIGDMANTATVGLCLVSVGIWLPMHAWFLLMLASRASGVVPTTPGSIGVQEAAQVLVLGLFGVAGEPALSFAILYHMAHLIPVTLAGVIEARRHF